MPQRCNSLFITPGTHSGHRSDPGPEEESATVKPQPDGSDEGGQAVPGESGAQGSLTGPLCSADHHHFQRLLVQHSPLPPTSSPSSTQQCPSLLASPQPSFQGHASLPEGHRHSVVLALPGERKSQAEGRAYPGGRASRASTAARAGRALEPEAASSASPELVKAGRAGATELSATLDAAGVGTLAPAAGLSSSMSAAPAASPFTGKAEGRDISTQKE